MKDEFEELLGESGSRSYTTQCNKHKIRFYGHKGEVRMWNCPKCPKKKVHLDPTTQFWLGDMWDYLTIKNDSKIKIDGHKETFMVSGLTHTDNTGEGIGRILNLQLTEIKEEENITDGS